MFSTTSSSVPFADRIPAPTAEAHPRRRVTSAPNLDEAYELRLLGEVARWDDQTAFEELYALHEAAVKRTALAVCRNGAIAEEIVQHTFTALWVRAARLVDKSVRLRPWLMTVARNAAIDHVRAERPVDGIEAAERVAATDARPEASALEAELTAELGAALATLSPEQRAAIELVYFAGLTYERAAAKLGEPIGTVKSRVRLALGHLRGRLGSATA